MKLLWNFILKIRFEKFKILFTKNCLKIKDFIVIAHYHYRMVAITKYCFLHFMASLASSFYGFYGFSLSYSRHYKILFPSFYGFSGSLFKVIETVGKAIWWQLIWIKRSVSYQFPVYSNRLQLKFLSFSVQITITCIILTSRNYSSLP